MNNSDKDIEINKNKIQHPFVNPDDYFENLSNQILRKNYLDALKSDKLFTTPENYFNENLINIESKVFLSSIDKQNIFEPSSEYFNELNVNILLKTVLVESTNVFKTPDLYFEKTENKILEKAREEVKIKSISDYFTTWITYAAAACILLVSTVSIVRFSKTTNSTYQLGTETKIVTIADLNKSDIKQYLQENVNTEEVIQELSTNTTKHIVDEIKKEHILNKPLSTSEKEAIHIELENINIEDFEIDG